MDIVEFKEIIEEALMDEVPNLEIYVASSGEIIISTGLTEGSDGELVEMDIEEDEEIDPDMEPLDLEDEDD
jgi:hypothetical protein